MLMDLVSLTFLVSPEFFEAFFSPFFTNFDFLFAVPSPWRDYLPGPSQVKRHRARSLVSPRAHMSRRREWI